MEDAKGEGPKSFTENNRASLQEILEQDLRPLFRKENPRVISVGCGFGFEALPVARLFPGAHYLGIDIDEDVVVYGARELNKSVVGVSFEVRDATDVASFGNEKWDLVILRHPQPLGSGIAGGSSLSWEKIISNSVEALDEDGTLLAIFQSDFEADAFLHLTKGKIRVVKHVKHRNAIPDSADYAIVIGKKK